MEGKTLKNNRSMLSSDLDIFGWADDQEGTDQVDEATYDIFGDSTGEINTDAEPAEGSEDTAAADTKVEDDESKEDSAEEKTETPADEASEEADEAKTGDEVPEELDFDIEKLLQDIEAEADKSNNDDLNTLIDSLRKELADSQTEKAMLAKTNEVLNEKLLSRVWDDSDMWMYKWIITKLEDNPKLMVLIKWYWNTDEKVKNRLTWIVSDIVEEITWQDISELLTKAQQDKIMWAVWEKSWSWVPVKFESWEEEDEDMNFDQAINKLW